VTFTSEAQDRKSGPLASRLRALKAQVAHLLTDESEEGHAKRTGLTALTIRVVAAAIAYASHVVLARFLGTFEYGIYAYVWVWVTILGPATTFGMSHSVYRFVPHYREMKQEDLIRGFINGGSWFVIASACTVGLVGAGAIYLLRDSLHSYYVLPFIIGAVLLPLVSMQDYVEGVARSYSWIGTAVAPPFILRQSLIVVGVLGVVLLGGPEWATAEMAIVTAIGATVLALCVHIVLVRRRLKAVLPKGPKTYLFRRWIATSVPILSVDLSQSLFGYVDILILSLYWPPDMIAVYFAATRIQQLVQFVRYAATAATAQRYSANAAKDNQQAQVALAQATTKWMFWMSLAGGLFIVAIGHFLLSLFGAEFPAAYPVLVLLIVAMVFQTTCGSAEDLLNMTGHERISAAVSVSSVILNLCLNLVFVPVWGIMGAAAATAIAMGLRTTVLGVAARNRTGVEVFVWNIPHGKLRWPFGKKAAGE